MPVPRASTSAPISRYKRARPAINAEFEINPLANGGVPFAFDDVVRGRRHRHNLDAGECEECRDVRFFFYMFRAFFTDDVQVVRGGETASSTS